MTSTAAPVTAAGWLVEVKTIAYCLGNFYAGRRFGGGGRIGVRMGVGSASLLLAGARSPSCRSVRGAYQGIAKAWLAVVRVVSQACLTCTV